jgi:hypothetical protein
VGVVTFRGAILTTSVTQTTASAGVYVVISNWTELLDTDGFYTAGNQSIVIPAGLGGVYHVSGQISSPTQTAASHAQLTIFLNGVTAAANTEWIPNVAGYTHGVSTSGIVSLVPGDTVSLRFRASAAGISVTAADLRVHFLGA